MAVTSLINQNSQIDVVKGKKDNDNSNNMGSAKSLKQKKTIQKRTKDKHCSKHDENCLDKNDEECDDNKSLDQEEAKKTTEKSMLVESNKNCKPIEEKDEAESFDKTPNNNKQSLDIKSKKISQKKLIQKMTNPDKKKTKENHTKKSSLTLHKAEDQIVYVDGIDEINTKEFTPNRRPGLEDRHYFADIYDRKNDKKLPKITKKNTTRANTLLTDELAYYNLQVSLDVNKNLSRERKIARRSLQKQLPILKSGQQEKEGFTNSQNFQSSTRPGTSNNQNDFINSFNEQEESHILSIIQTFLNDKTLDFFEDFTLDNIQVIIKATQVLKSKYQKLMNSVQSFIKGIRSFLRFKVVNNKNFTNADKTTNTKNYESKISGGNKWVEIYKDFCMPNLKQMSKKLLNSSLNDENPPLKPNSTVHGNTLMKKIEAQRQNSSISGFNKLKDIMKQDVYISTNKVDDVMNIRQKIQSADLEAVISNYPHVLKVEQPINQSLTEKYSFKSKIFTNSEYLPISSSKSNRFKPESDTHKNLQLESSPDLANLQSKYLKNPSVLLQNKSVITLDSIKNNNKSHVDEKIYKPVALNIEAGYKSYANKYNLGSTFKDMASTRVQTKNRPLNATYTNNRLLHSQSSGNISQHKSFISKSHAKELQDNIYSYREAKMALDSVKNGDKCAEKRNNLRNLNKF